MELWEGEPRREERTAIRVAVPQSVNPNTASYDELRRLRGIGAHYAKRIIERRPYHSMEALVTKARIPSYVLERIRDLIAIEPRFCHERRMRCDEESVGHRRKETGRAESESRDARSQETMSVQPAKNVLAGAWETRYIR